ncbi:hypothetical protein JCM11641_001447 [Rhodosporidiobolus odoratus]
MSNSSYSPYQQPHPQFAGKGLPPPVSAPQFNSSAYDASYPQYPSHAPENPYAGYPPDLTERYKLKAKYGKLQKRYFRGIETGKDLKLELAEKEAKVQALQDEVDLIIDQIASSDYAHLRPALDDLFSDSEGEEGGEDGNPERVKAEDEDGTSITVKGKQRRTLKEEEQEKRSQIEAVLGIDGSRPNLLAPPPFESLDPSLAPPPAQLPPLQQLQQLPP